MVKWSTEVRIPEAPNRIDYGHRGLLLGSCFSERIGQRLHYYQFPQLTNPFGVVYHPSPIREWLRRAGEGEAFREEELIENQGLWRHLLAHSSRSATSKKRAVGELNSALEQLKEQLQRMDYFILTLGTAYGFRHRASDLLVANCHKLPQADFKKELSSVDALQEMLLQLLGELRRLNPGVRPILTVSPVRHLREGLIENQRSKAHLISAAHAVAESGLASYFPAYEILMDELRDYRFYDTDLAHPSTVAVQYIWERFRQAWIDPDAAPVMRRVEEIRKGLAHRPLHPGSAAETEFQKALHIKIRELQQRYPFMEFPEGDSPVA
jgi:hypothetical protein